MQNRKFALRADCSGCRVHFILTCRIPRQAKTRFAYPTHTPCTQTVGLLPRFALQNAQAFVWMEIIELVAHATCAYAVQRLHELKLLNSSLARLVHPSRFSQWEEKTAHEKMCFRFCRNSFCENRADRAKKAEACQHHNHACNHNAAHHRRNGFSETHSQKACRKSSCPRACSRNWDSHKKH